MTWSTRASASNTRATTIRLDMLEEAVQVCRAMFTGDDVSFAGKHFRLDHARNLPRPVQAAGPKIMIGGGGEKRTLRLVALYADKCNVTGDVSTLARKIEVLHRHCADVGRDPAEIDITWMTPLILTTSKENTAEVRDLLEAGGSAEEIAGSRSASLERSPIWWPGTSQPVPTRSYSVMHSATPRGSLPWATRWDSTAHRTVSRQALGGVLELLPTGTGNRNKAVPVRNVTRHQAPIICLLPYRKTRARRPPGIEHLVVWAGFRSYPLEQVQDERINGLQRRHVQQYICRLIGVVSR